MIDFEAVIRHFGPQAVELQWEDVDTDERALEAVRKSEQSPDRVAEVLGWLTSYEVFRGIDGLKRTAITKAILGWADAQDEANNLGSIDALVEAHRDLAKTCCDAYEKHRDFTSLASKALWLRYPEAVPLFDSFARRTLWVISKIERDIAPPDGRSEYHKFAFAWTALYERYDSAITAIDLKGYQYRVRIFDKILWIIGTRAYNYPFS